MHLLHIYSAGRKNVNSAQRHLHNCQKKKNEKKENIKKRRKQRCIHRTTRHPTSYTHTHTYILVSAKVRCSFWDKKRTFYKTKIGKTLEQKKRSKKKETKKFIYTKRKRNNINKAALQVISEGNTSILATLYICIYS